MTILRILPLFLLFSLQPVWAQNEPATADNKLVPLNGVDVKGTRIPAASIIRLSGLKVGQQVNHSIINEACRKITATGLVKSIDYAYDVAPGSPGVVLSFTVVDELPLLPTRIVPPEDADKIWGCLQGADPIFTRELPNTKNAIEFYTANIEKCIAEHGQHDAYVKSTVGCEPSGKAIEIIFDIMPKEVSAEK